jgi:hypothetical protein
MLIILQSISDSLRVINDSLRIAIAEQPYFALSIQAQIAIIAATSSIIAIFLNLFINKVAYKNEYYKKVIDKRIEVIKNIDSFLNNLGRLYTTSGEVYYSFFKSKQEFIEFYDKDFAVVLNGTLWVCKDLEEKILKQNDIFYDELIAKADEINFLNEGIKRFNECALFYYNVEKHLYEELASLHNVKKFLKSKSRKKSKLSKLSNFFSHLISNKLKL